MSPCGFAVRVRAQQSRRPGTYTASWSDEVTPGHLSAYVYPHTMAIILGRGVASDLKNALFNGRSKREKLTYLSIPRNTFFFHPLFCIASRVVLCTKLQRCYGTLFSPYTDHKRRGVRSTAKGEKGQIWLWHLSPPRSRRCHRPPTNPLSTLHIHCRLEQVFHS